MNDFFIIMFSLSILALLVGLIRPLLFKFESRKKVWKIFGIAVPIFFILIAVTSPSSSQSKDTQSLNPVVSAATTTSQKQNVPTTDPEEDQIKALVTNVLKGTTNMSHENKLKSVDVVKQVNGGWGVFIEFNADDNLTAHLTKNGIEMEMSDIYIALYTSGKNISTASIAAYLSLTDSYGNTSDQMVYKSILDKDVASKVNWSFDKSSLELQIIPGLWSTTIFSPVLK